MAQRMRRRREPEGGFALIDLMVTLTIVAIMAAVLFPRIADDDHLRLTAAARLIASDIEMAQVMTISNPAEPIIVKFEPGGTYWLAPAADPDTPIVRSGAIQPYRVVFGQGRGRTAADVTLVLTDLENNTLSFNEQGGLVDLNLQPEIKLVHGSEWVKLTLSTMTGTITETAGSG